MSAPRRAQRFHVGIKAFLVRDGRLLVLRESAGAGLWELPGGRIDVGEEQLAATDVLRRELREELGPGLRCEIGAPLTTWIRPVASERDAYTFLVGFLCAHVAGEPQLSHEHRELRWVDREMARELDLAPGYAAAFERFWSRISQECPE